MPGTLLDMPVARPSCPVRWWEGTQEPEPLAPAQMLAALLAAGPHGWVMAWSPQCGSL